MGVDKKLHVLTEPSAQPRNGGARRRRSFFTEAFRASVGTLVGSSAAAALAACAPGRQGEGDEDVASFPAALNGRVQLDISSYEGLKPVGGSVIGRPGGLMEPIIVIQDTEGHYVVVAAVCSHASCPLAYNALNFTVDCGCHGSTFELDGRVINGPAVLPIRVYPSNLEGQILTITMAA
jgi:Rieske Fe-S protein